MAQIAVKFEQGVAVYAQSIDPPFGFNEIIGIDLGSGQTRTLDEIVLPVDITLGATEIVIGGTRYELVISSVRVQLDKTNCDYVPGTRYGGKPPAIEVTETFTRAKEGKTSWRAGLGAKFGFGDQTVSVDGAAERSSAHSNNTALSVTRAIPVAQPEGADAVRIKLPEGISGGLTGTVMSAVAADDSLTPYCRLIAKDVDKAVTGRIRVQARPSDMKLNRLDKAKKGGKAAQVREAGLRAGEAAMERQQAEQDDVLRQKVALMALMPRSPNPGQHIDLATKGFCFYPQFDDEQ